MNESRLEATIEIPVDPYNPGEFFACCGLLELAHRLSIRAKRAQAWFETEQHHRPRFLMNAHSEEGPLTLENLISQLQECRVSTERPASKEGPIILGKPFDISLDLRSPFPQSRLTKTFAGQQNLFDIVHALHQAVRSVPRPEIAMTSIWHIYKSTSQMVTAFATQKAENAIDAGFSMDTQKGRLLSQHPIFVELLALIGTQRFCPATSEHSLARIYYAWHTPLTAPLAAIAASTHLSGISQTGFIFHMYKRDPKGRYKGFSPARSLS